MAKVSGLGLGCVDVLATWLLLEYHLVPLGYCWNRAKMLAHATAQLLLSSVCYVVRPAAEHWHVIQQAGKTMHGSPTDLLQLKQGVGFGWVSIVYVIVNMARGCPSLSPGQNQRCVSWMTS